MSVTETFPDVEGGMRDFLRAHPNKPASVSGVFFGVPDVPTFPLITVQRVGGGDDISEAPIDVALIQIDCWGELDAAGHGDKAGCDTVRRFVRRACYGIRGATALNASTVAYGAGVLGDLYVPDPDNHRPRYTLTIQITARSA